MRGNSRGGKWRRPWQRYELLKAEWIAAHPCATQGEYTAAVREIAKNLGL